MFKAIIEFFKRLFGIKSTEPEIKEPVPNQGSRIDPLLLINYIEASFGNLTATQVTGFKFILDKWNESGLTDNRWLAYMYATVWHETARTMRPITEYGSQEYLTSKPYYPYIGRGYVQLTWDYNYKKYGIENNMQKALDPEFAAHIMIDGMVKGIFTGKGLDRYFNAQTNDPVNARRIINGIDKADIIADYHRRFLSAIEKSIV